MRTQYQTYHAPDQNFVAAPYTDSSRKLLAKLTVVKENIFREFADTTDANQHSIHLAINEAEALAWETGVPQLIFPTLALEKIRSIVEWRARQNSILHGQPTLAFAA